VSSELPAMASLSTSINELPDEILLHIFSYFGLEDLSLKIAKVCEHWKCLAIDVILLKRLSVNYDRSTDISLIKEVSFKTN
jgi:hypothetical protein